MKDQQQLDNKSLTAEAKYPINFKQSGKGFVRNKRLCTALM